MNKVKELRDCGKSRGIIVPSDQRKDCKNHVVLLQFREQRANVILGDGRRGEGSEDVEVLVSFFSFDDEAN
jgi:hypothetical protein